jgi:hypothetical protein
MRRRGHDPRAAAGSTGVLGDISEGSMTLEVLVHSALVGILASYVLLALAVWNKSLGLPRLDFAKAMTMLTYGESFEGSEPSYWAGQLVIYMNGIIFTLLYTGVVAQYLPGPDLLKGVIWGAILWFVSGVFYVPFYLKEGFFLSHIHKNAWFASGLVHGAFGLVVGWLAPIVYF